MMIMEAIHGQLVPTVLKIYSVVRGYLWQKKEKRHVHI